VALEELHQPTILLGTTTFTAKARAELQAWGLPDQRYLEVPHGYQDLEEERFAAVLSEVVEGMRHLLGNAI
jgi:hypothetical protein